MKQSTILLLLMSGTIAQRFPVVPTAGAQAACAPVHIIVARASTEQPGYGVTGLMVQQLVKDIPGATSEPIVYPAQLAPYPQSESQGVEAAKLKITAYVQKCPQAKIVLAGYSQGADVM